jgi:ABC-type multidrug transport system fused ATPase/permease subunit
MASLPLVPLLRLNVPPRPSGTGSSNGSGQIQELSFYDVTADVRIHRGFRERISSSLRLNSNSSSTAAAAVVTGDVEQGGLKSSKSGHSLAEGASYRKGDKSPLGRVRASPRGPRNTDDDTLPLTEQQQQLSAAVPAVADSGSSARWRRVLAGVSGCVGSGEVLGIMGPSGGGKSTLLMKLCGGLGGHSRGGEWRSGGVVCLDGVVVPPSLLTAVTALVPQDDSLMRSLTVEECIRWVLGVLIMGWEVLAWGRGACCLSRGLVTALVPQDDSLMRSLTVQECIWWVQGC